MFLFQLFLIPAILLTVALHAAQFHDFKEWRAQLIDCAYLAIIIALIIYAKVFPWQNGLF